MSDVKTRFFQAVASSLARQAFMNFDVEAGRKSSMRNVMCLKEMMLFEGIHDGFCPGLGLMGLSRLSLQLTQDRRLPLKKAHASQSYTVISCCPACAAESPKQPTGNRHCVAPDGSGVAATFLPK